MRLKASAAGAAALILFLLIGCLLDNRQAGRGSEVENEVYGTLVDANGKPVQGARVKAMPASAAADTDSVLTDARGRYVFDSLAAGSYSLLGDYGSGSLLVYIPEVDIPDSGKNVGVDTLRVPGSIRGRFLAGSTGKAGVFAVVAGLSRLDLSDDSGRFQIESVPQGRYSVRYSATGFVIPQDTGVEVRSGQITVLPDKHLQYDPALSPPEPIGLKAAYDTLNERVILSWEAVPVADLDGFLVYRDDPAALEPQLVPGGFTKSASFIDPSFAGLLDAGGRELVYRVRSRDLKLNKSINFSDPVSVRAVPKSWVTTTASIRVAGLLGGAASPGDSLLLILAYANPTRHIRSIAWFANSGSDPLPVEGMGDTLRWATRQPGTESFTARLLDDAGTMWTTSAAYPVLRDAPLAMAGPDQQVSVSDSVRLQGAATDGYGRVARWEWSIGGAPFQEAPAGAFGFRVPPSAGTIPCVLRVTDDDRISALDTLLVSVSEDPPTVGAGRDTAVSIGDMVALRGTASDRFGRISAMAWDIGGAGVYRPTEDGKASFSASAQPGIVPCVFKAEDDDGKVSLDTVLVSVVRDSPLAHAGRDTTVSLGDLAHLRGSASDGLGMVVATEWDIGATGMFRAAALETTIVAPSTPNPAYRCVLRVTDDDGNQGLDTVSIAILMDPPVAAIQAPDTALSGGEIRLAAGKSTPGAFGKIAGYEWSVGSFADFRPGKADTSVTAPAREMERYPVVLRVTDDDGLVALDTHFVAITYQWQVLGDQGFATGYIPTLAVHEDKPYLSIVDQGTPETQEGRGTVLTLQGGLWREIGPRRFTEAWCDFFTLDLASDGTPYTVCEQQYPLVHRFTGSAWEQLTGASPVTGKLNNPTIRLHEDVPYVIYTANDLAGAASLVKFDSGAWSQVGPASVSPGPGWQNSVAFLGDVPYVAYQDGSGGNRASVSKLTAQGWAQVGGYVSRGAAPSVRLIAQEGTLYIAYSDEALGNRTTLKRLVGSDWEIVGAEGFSAPSSGYQIDVGAWKDTVFVAVQKGVMRFANGKWSQVGKALPAPPLAFALDRGRPYVYFVDPAKGPTIMSYR
jgi:hypothetical protein